MRNGCDEPVHDAKGDLHAKRLRRKRKTRCDQSILCICSLQVLVRYSVYKVARDLRVLHGDGVHLVAQRGKVSNSCLDQPE